MRRCDARRNGPIVDFTDSGGEGREPPPELIKRIAANALTELRLMRGTLGSAASTLDFASLEQCTLTALSHILLLMERGQIRPWIRVGHSPGAAPAPETPRIVRVGIFPIAANPLHWAHLVGGLFAMESFGLDKVVYVIAGGDPRKPDLASEETRHAMARTVLGLFHPLFEYSSIARGGAASGEENLFRILAMNPRQRLHAFYIAGGDHCHRRDPCSGRPDTIQKLEDGVSVHLRGNAVHSVSVVFLERGRAGDREESTLDVRWVGGPPVETSSTAIRSALPDPAQWKKLSTLPFAAFSSIRENRLYEVHTGALTSLASL
jgi:nicotinic acid mononucleotide adenylyltransferase